jgi:hypothetical protein
MARHSRDFPVLANATGEKEYPCRRRHLFGGAKLTGLFPDGSLGSPSEALPGIWADWERFSVLAQRLAAYAGALESAASNQRSAAGGHGGSGDLAALSEFIMNPELADWGRR